MRPLKNLLLNILGWAVPAAAWLYLQAVGRTTRCDVSRAPSLRGKDRTGVIYAFWHGRQFYLVWAYRGRPVSILVSRSRDGAIISRVIRALGMDTVRGSSSRGGARALIELKRLLASGRSIGITPDGPKGPRGRVNPGAIYLARKTGRPIIPVAYSAARRLVFRGWDEYWVPLPFGRAAVAEGAPVTVGRNDDIAAKTEELRQALDRVAAAADARVSMPEEGLSGSMVFWLYTAGMLLFSPVVLAGIFLRYPGTFVRHFSRGLAMRFGSYPGKVSREGKRVWVHASSLGECRASAPLIRALREAFPDAVVIFSCTTFSGIAEAGRLGLGDHRVYAPLDIPWVVSRSLNWADPDLLVLLESELWPNWIRLAKSRGAAVGIVNGRISDRSAARYAKVRRLTQVWLGNVDFVCAREDGDAERYASIGVPRERVAVTGNLKYDVVPEGRPPSSAWAGEGPVWVAGSIREGEAEMLLSAYFEIRREVPRLKLVLAPRHLDSRGEIFANIRNGSARTELRSRLLDPGPGRRPREWDILIWDTFGDLAEAYAAASAVFIGGSLVPKGGQNPIEPAWQSKPLLFGPSMENFREPARLLLEAGGAVQVRNGAALTREAAALLKDPAGAELMGRKARECVEGFSGRATRAALAVLEGYLRA